MKNTPTPKKMSAQNPTTKAMQLSEKQIENMILNHLRAKRIFAWKTQTVGIFDPTKRVYRTPSASYMRGVADIIGIYNGRPLAIEVKAAKGRVSEVQTLFLARFKENGGIGFVARSIEEVDETLARWNFQQTQTKETK